MISGRRGVIAVLILGPAACATPGQVHRVETQVAILDRDHARADSARQAEMQHIIQLQRQNSDSINLLVRQLNDNVQQLARETSGSFDNLRQQLYQVATLANTTQSRVAHLSSQVETAVATAPPAPPPPAAPGDTGAAAGAPAPTIPPPDALLQQASRMMDQSSFGNARIALNTLLQTYPNASQVPDAIYYLGYSFDPDQPDSARVYYTRVYKDYPTSVRAPTALFKLGELENRAHNTADARRYWQMIVDKYPNSDEFASAQDHLHNVP